MRILSVSSSRADVGILAPVWRALAARADCALHILLTGMHCADGAPDADGVPASATIHRGGRDLGGERANAGRAMAAITAATAKVLEAHDFDAMLIIGDRLDMIPAALAALPFNLPIAHLHGGEVTEGAVDDRVRNALSQIASLHCVSTGNARARLVAMGVDATTIRVTGTPGLDTLAQAPAMSAAAFAAAVGLAGTEGLRLVTVHPETASVDPLAPVDAVLVALAARPAPTLFTAANSDPGGLETQRRIDSFVAGHEWAHFRGTLGAALYPNALRHAAVMIGNSSSGIIEAGLFGLPVIDVGARQRGRERGANVVAVANDATAIGGALDRLGPCPARGPRVSPYGDGKSGPRVADAIVAWAGDAPGRVREPMAEMAR